MSDQLINEQYRSIMELGGQAYVRNLAAAELAIQRGQFNVSKVLRAAAHTQRTLAMQAARKLAEAFTAEDVLVQIAAEVDALPRLDGINEAARESIASIVGRAQLSLETNPDILESDVPIIIMGCYSCGTITERPVEICPECGALRVEFEWFGPFYAETPEHLGQLTPQGIITTLIGIPDQVAAALDGVDDEALSQKPSADEWSIKEIVAHMFETDIAFLERAQTILEKDGVPPLPRSMPPWKLHEGKGYESYSGDELLGRMREVRGATVEFVSRLSDRDWVRQGTLMGSVTSIVDLGTWVANHDLGHLAQIKRLCGK